MSTLFGSQAEIGGHACPRFVRVVSAIFSKSHARVLDLEIFNVRVCVRARDLDLFNVRVRFRVLDSKSCDVRPCLRPCLRI